MIDIEKHKFIINDISICFFAPKLDSTFPGTLAEMSKNSWRLGEIDFKKGDTFIDVGCNVGIVSMVFAKFYPEINVVSLDANPITIKCLDMGIAENKLNNIRSHNLSLGPTSKKDVKFLTYNENESCLIQDELCQNERSVSFKCDMVSMEDLFEKLDIQNIKYLKIDIETGEFELFNHIFKNNPSLLSRIENLHVEIHPFDDSNPPSKELKGKLKEFYKDKVRFF